MTCGGTKPTSGCKCAPNRLARAGKWADRSGQLTCPGACKCATFCPTPELILRAKSGQLTCPGACKCATFCPTPELVIRAKSGQLTCPGACKCATPQWSRIDWMKVDQSHAPEHVSWSTCPGPHASSRDPKWPAVGTSFVQHETHRDRDPGGYRHVVQNPRPESPLADGFLRCLVEHGARALQDHFLNVPFPIHEDSQDHRALHLSLTRQLGIFRLGRVHLARQIIEDHDLFGVWPLGSHGDCPIRVETSAPTAQRS